MILIQFVITVLCAYIAGQCIYNLFFHPLRSYPGPLLCRVSSLPRLWHRLAGTSIQHAHLAHERHGAVVRLSPTELSYISSDAWNDIYAKHDGNAALPKEPAFHAAPPDAPRGLVLAIDGPSHARQRRVFAPAFSNTALKKQEALVLGHVRKLVAHLERACASDAGGGGVKVNVADLFNFTTFDVMADLAFGAPLGLLDAGTYSLYVRNVFAVFRLLSLRAVVGFYLPWVYALMMRRLSTKAVRERRSAHMNYGAELVDKRLDQAEGLEHADIWSLVERKQDVLTRREMHINASVFMAAGTETTATALCGAVWYLTGNPEKMKKLVEEVRGEAVVEEFTMETLARLPYLNAVISESLRLYPPTPDMMYRLVPEGGAMICGTHVPAGAVVGLHQWPAYHSSKNFHRPEEFIPERWLTDADSSGEFAKDDKRVVQPFSRGPRSCIGKNLALHEIRLALAHVLWHFDLSFAEESTNWIQQKSFIVWEKSPLMVKLTRAA